LMLSLEWSTFLSFRISVAKWPVTDPVKIFS
jgi:hypothetical protein